MITIIGIETAKAFAEEHNCPNAYVIENYRNDIPPRGLDVPGFCKVIKVFRFESKIEDGVTYWTFSHASYRLLIEDTGEMLQMYHFRPTANYTFGLNEPFNAHGRDQHFVPTVKAPNKVGKGSRKAIEAWLDYLHLANTERADYYNRNLFHNNARAQEFKYKFSNPENRWTESVEYDGWVSWFSFRHNGLIYTYHALEGGGFSRTEEICFGDLPTDEQLLA